jgi:hypothetical protein
MRNEAGERVRALAELKEGSWARRQASWPRNPAMCASAHVPVHGEGREGGTDREGPRCREREKKGGASNGSALGRMGPRDRERRGTRAGEATSADRSAPVGRERERERARGRESRR